jgi:hypothetical protein
VLIEMAYDIRDEWPEVKVSGIVLNVERSPGRFFLELPSHYGIKGTK